MKKTILDFDYLGKKVLLRLDLNVPMENGIITSDKRIVESLPTIKYLLEKNAKVIICSHLGRPEGVDKKFSLKPVCDYLSKLLNTKVNFSKEAVGEVAQKNADKLKDGEVLVLENIRFYGEEEKCDEDFSKKLSSLADIFINDAFGTAHRKHCSTYGVAKYIPSGVGFLMQKEIKYLTDCVVNPKRPFIAILGGAKISDKIKVIENLLDKVDILVIGGGMCFTFIKALKGEVGNSLVDNEQVDFCYNMIKKAVERKVKLLLPVDFVCNTAIDADLKNIKVFSSNNIKNDYMGLDIGPKTIKLFKKYIKKGKTIVWNGPMGVFEQKVYSLGTIAVASQMAKNKHAITIVGGGDSVAAVEQLKLENKFTHISTGGGASLKLLEGKVLPAIEVISEKE